jgi:hypothetical protein
MTKLRVLVLCLSYFTDNPNFKCALKKKKGCQKKSQRSCSSVAKTKVETTVMLISTFREIQQQPVWTSDVHLLFTDLQQTTNIVLKLPWTCNHVYLGNCTCTSVLLQSSAFTNHLPHTKHLQMLPAIWSEEFYATLYAPQWTINCLLYKFSP